MSVADFGQCRDRQEPERQQAGRMMAIISSVVATAA